MKNYDMIYVSKDGVLCRFNFRSSSQSAAIQAARGILNPGDQLLYVCPASCRLFSDKYMPAMVSIDTFNINSKKDI